MPKRTGYHINDQYSTYFTLQKLAYIHNNPVVAGIIDQPDAYVHSSARNYAGRKDVLLPVEVIDFGIMEGYVAT